MTFYKYFQPINKPKIWDTIQQTTQKQVAAILEKSSWNLKDFPLLISDSARPFLTEMEQASRRITRASFGNNMALYAPLYISNHCLNSCTYCGFNVRNKIPRHTLAHEEVIKEAEYLHRDGFRQILLLTGEHRIEVPLSTLVALGEQLSPKFNQISVEIYPLQEEEYAELSHAGIKGITVYQETYSQTRYPRFHRGPKADYIFRLETPERAARAGFKQLGIGALLGLANPQMELWSVATHAAWLLEQYPDVKTSVSFPRIRDAEGTFKPEFAVSDGLLKQAVYALRMVMPKLDLVLSTREHATFRDDLALSGITRMSAGSKTSPGGYSIGKNLKMSETEEADQALEQFHISDNRRPVEVVESLRRQGLFPSDWAS